MRLTNIIDLMSRVSSWAHGTWSNDTRLNEKQKITFTFRRCSFQMHKRTRWETGHLSMDAHKHAPAQAHGVWVWRATLAINQLGQQLIAMVFHCFCFGWGCLAMRSFVIRGRTRRSSYTYTHRHIREMQTCNNITFVHRWPGWLESYYTFKLKCHIFIILNVLLRLTWIALGTCKA